ncbi:MAG TPA: histidine kinase, partial [Tahibacter sp.]|nr:histidine kinase [Tahibacter sp.]
MHRIQRHARVVALVALVWLAYALVTAAQVHELESAADPNVTFAMCLALLAPGALGFWTPLTLAFLALARRFPLTRERWFATGAVLCAAIALAVLARAAFTWATHGLAGAIYAPWAQPLPPPDALITQSFFYNQTKILLIVFVCYLYVHVEKTQAGRVRIAELETRLTHARLDALSAQLHPHFLFNAMNSIAELIHHDADAADRMLVSLGGLLRYSLARPEHEISVREETALVAQYLAIEKIRLGERLDVRWSVDPDCLDARVPALLLQPLAENAIAHGIARRRAPGTLALA